MVAVRQWVAGVVLLARRCGRGSAFTRAQWRPVLALALIFAIMNLSLYGAIDRIGLGLAVTLEFLGPLSVALLASRRALDLGLRAGRGAPPWWCWPGRSRPPTTWASRLGLAAATCWAGYILVNRVDRRAAARRPGPGGRRCSVGAAVRAGRHLGAGHPPGDGRRARPRGAAGVLCSAVPMVADLLALRRVPASSSASS